MNKKLTPDTFEGSIAKLFLVAADVAATGLKDIFADRLRGDLTSAEFDEFCRGMQYAFDGMLRVIKEMLPADAVEALREKFNTDCIVNDLEVELRGGRHV